jgi:hypothetical protein
LTLKVTKTSDFSEFRSFYRAIHVVSSQSFILLLSLDFLCDESSEKGVFGSEKSSEKTTKSSEKGLETDSKSSETGSGIQTQSSWTSQAAKTSMGTSIHRNQEKNILKMG